MFVFAAILYEEYASFHSVSDTGARNAQAHLFFLTSCHQQNVTNKYLADFFFCFQIFTIFAPNRWELASEEAASVVFVGKIITALAVIRRAWNVGSFE